MALLTTTGAAADRNSVYPGQSWDQSEQARGPLSPPGSLCLKPGPWRYDEMYETKTIGFHPHGSLLRSHSGGNLACASVEDGGMFDGWGRRVFRFPADGHPDMCVAVVDLTGDCRDEMVVWDPN